LLNCPDTQVHKVRGAVLRKKGGPLTIESLEMEGPADDEVLVRIVASGICHTDIEMIDYWDSAQVPVVLGHEGAGLVEQVGKQVKGVTHGDHVVLSYQSCGACRKCRNGHPTDCKRFYELNFDFVRSDGGNAMHRSGVRGHFFGQSSFATYVVVTKRNLVKVPKDLPLEMLAPLRCGSQTGAGTVMNSLKVSKGASVAIFGTGSVGLAAIMAAHIVEAAPIVGIDIKPSRLDVARELGATHVIDSTHDDVSSRIRDITGNGVDYVVDTTGDWKMQVLAIQALNPRGIVGLLAGGVVTNSLTEGRRTIGIIQGDAIPQRFIPKMIDLYRVGQFPFDRLVKFYDFDDINTAIYDSRRGDTIKPVLRIS
jgi:aryl-alcohol dehydrogenase